VRSNGEIAIDALANGAWLDGRCAKNATATAIAKQESVMMVERMGLPPSLLEVRPSRMLS
jgi:hypothetical protein